jgi:1-acyl-sn-glycerol-3-phosphate acyltransferase
MQAFEAIRPYKDSETHAALDWLINSEEFLQLISRSRAPVISRLAPGLARFWVQRWLRRRFGHINTIDDVQAALYPYIDDLIRKTTSRVSVSGLDALERDKCHLFICNHRDIVFDPMVINYLLYNYGSRTTQIAIGDNLLHNRLFAELMRLNKSFVVKRKMSSAREMRDTYQTLSAFIHHSIADNQSIWIAQREGRAKDGIDCTDPAIIKMLYMSRKKTGSEFADVIKTLRIVPVSIAYEYDPCDITKARELACRAQTGEYRKGPNEDEEQIVQGLTGFKGHVHVHFGKPIMDPPKTPLELANRIDAEMHAGYHLHASNLAAHNLSQTHDRSHESTATYPETVFTAETYSPADMEASQAELQRRLDSVDEALRPHLLAMYANPVASALAARTEHTP